MIPVFYVDDIITKAEQSGATVKEIVRDMLKIHNDALRESEELNKPIHFNREDFFKNRLYVGVQKESKEDIVKCKTEFEGIEKYLFLRMEALNDAIYSAKSFKKIYWKTMDVDESEAWETAENNVRKETEIIQLSGFPMSAEECEMFVISNKSRFRGASAVLNKKLWSICKSGKYKENLILPSSIHEMILIPCHDCEYDIESCSEIVKLVNENEVELTEQLTDRAYIIEV
mgnify:CR=1 FL=1